MWQVPTAYAQLTSFRMSFGSLSEVSKESGITKDHKEMGSPSPQQGAEICANCN